MGSTVQLGDKKLLFFLCFCLTSHPVLSIDRPSCVLATSNGFHMTTGQNQTSAQTLTNLTTISLQQGRREEKVSRCLVTDVSCTELSPPGTAWMYPLWQASRSFLCFPGLLSWGPMNVVHSGKWHIKEWSGKAFTERSCSHRNALCWTKWKCGNERYTCWASLRAHMHSHMALCALLFIWACQLIMHRSLAGALSAIFWKSRQDAPMVSETSGVLLPGWCLKKSSWA